MNNDEVLPLLNAKLERADKALTRNWAIQIGLVALSLTYIFGDSSGVEGAADTLLGFTVDKRALPALLALLLLYHFVSFGYISGQFFGLRKECNAVVRRTRADGGDMPTKPSRATYKRLIETTNFFEPAFQKRYFKRKSPVVLVLVLSTTAAVIALSHASVLILIYLATQSSLLSRSIAYLVLVTLLVGCYLQMWKSKAVRRKPARVVILFAPTSGLLLFFYWYLCHNSAFDL